MTATARFSGFDPASLSTLVNEPVVRQHAGDAAFLWGQRDRAVFEPHFRLRDLVRWDGRVEAHLDGLRVAGDFGWGLCREALGEEDPGGAFSATVLAFGSGAADRVGAVLEAGLATPEMARGVISGLGWLEMATIGDRIAALARAGPPEQRRTAIAALAVHREDGGEALTRAVSDADPRLRGRAIQAAGELGRADLLPAILPSLADPDPEVGYRAAWSAALLGDREAAPRALDGLARGGSSLAEAALAAGLRVMPLERGLDRFRELRRVPATSRFAALAAGVIGLPELVPELFELMDDPAASRAAGEAFARITGVDLAYSDLDGEPPQPASDAGEPEIPAPDADEELAWPARGKVEAWWKPRRREFQPGTRHLLGQPLGREAIEHALVHGTQPQRAAAAFELALRDPARPLFETRARGDWQMRRLHSWTS